MKFSTLLGCASMAVIVYLLVGEFSRHQASEERAAALEKAKMEMRLKQAEDEARAAELEAARAPKSTRTGWALEETIIVRGRIIDKTLSGMIVNCDQPEEMPGWSQHEMAQYGALKAMNGEALLVSTWTPAAKVRGSILLIGHPELQRLAVGAGVKVVAAPLDDIYSYKPKDGPEYPVHVYTMVFNITSRGSAQKPSGDWMWDKHGPLDGGAYNKRAF